MCYLKQVIFYYDRKYFFKMRNSSKIILKFSKNFYNILIFNKLRILTIKKVIQKIF